MDTTKTTPVETGTGDCAYRNGNAAGANRGAWVEQAGDQGRQAKSNSHGAPQQIGASVGLATPLLARLEMVRPAGAWRWYARCPAHDDKTPSLSVREVGDRVLVHCFSGCAADDVLVAVGLGWKDLYLDPWHCARARPNEGARRYAKRALALADPLDHEREILRLAAADIRRGRSLSVEDTARVQVARERVAADRKRGAA